MYFLGSLGQRPKISIKLFLGRKLFFRIFILIAKERSCFFHYKNISGNPNL